MQREHVNTVFLENEWEEEKTKPQENETEQAMTRSLCEVQLKKPKYMTKGKNELFV
jgi:hypothetical protein